MEREWLQRKLQRHESVQAIAVSAGRHPATVAYWINKHGLCSPLRAKHASRGGIAHTELQSLVEQGLSIREIAAVCGFSASSIRYWLRRHGLRTRPSRYMHGESKPYEILRECRSHGWTAFRRAGRTGGYRCARCNTDRVSRRRRAVKEILLAEAGGACRLCGYGRYPGALQFHHLDPRTKGFHLAERGMTRALSVLREEARKCLLLCANCHAEVEAGVTTLTSSLVRDDPG